jgi:hypothetical protein
MEGLAGGLLLGEPAGRMFGLRKKKCKKGVDLHVINTKKL